MASDPFGLRINVENLGDLRRALRAIPDSQMPPKLRETNLKAAQIVATAAAANVPVRSGKAQASVRALASQTSARAKGGGAAVPYYGWIDFGGHVGRHHRTARPYIREGRYLYPALKAHRAEIVRLYDDAIGDLFRDAGLRRG